MPEMNISKYPEFEPLEKHHKSLFIDAFHQEPPEISEFTFTNLYSWRGVYRFSVAMLEGFIILKLGSEGGFKFFEPIGKGDKKSVISAVLNDCRSSFVRVPEKTKILFDEDKNFSIEPDLGNSDYLYKVSDLANLAGRKYDGKRNLIKKFKANNSYEYIELDASNVAGCLEFEERWCSIKDCEGIESLNNERRAIIEMLKNFSDLDIIGGAIKIGSGISAVALGENLNPNTLVMHALKADPDITGLYQALLNEFLLRQEKEFEYVNLEQDLGLEGLRKAKESYHPIRMIHKYTIRHV